MSELLVPKKSERGWIIQMTPDMAREAGVAEGSSLIVYLGAGGVSVEILPPATDEIKSSVTRSIEKFADAFTEMKRLGD